MVHICHFISSWNHSTLIEMYVYKYFKKHKNIWYCLLSWFHFSIGILYNFLDFLSVYFFYFRSWFSLQFGFTDPGNSVQPISPRGLNINLGSTESLSLGDSDFSDFVALINFFWTIVLGETTSLRGEKSQWSHAI